MCCICSFSGIDWGYELQRQRAAARAAFRAFILPPPELISLFHLPVVPAVFRRAWSVIKLPCWRAGRWKSLT